MKASSHLEGDFDSGEQGDAVVAGLLTDGNKLFLANAIVIGNGPHLNTSVSHLANIGPDYLLASYLRLDVCVVRTAE